MEIYKTPTIVGDQMEKNAGLGSVATKIFKNPYVRNTAIGAGAGGVAGAIGGDSKDSLLKRVATGAGVGAGVGLGGTAAWKGAKSPGFRKLLAGKSTAAAKTVKKPAAAPRALKQKIKIKPTKPIPRKIPAVKAGTSSTGGLNYAGTSSTGGGFNYVGDYTASKTPGAIRRASGKVKNILSRAKKKIAPDMNFLNP